MTTPETEHVEIACDETGATLRGRLVRARNAGPDAPVVMFVTGDGAKGASSATWTNLAPRFARVGIRSFLFDFEGLGASRGSRERLTVTRALANFRAAFAFLEVRCAAERARIGILASSFGGTITLLAPDVTNRASALGLKSPATFLPEAYVNEAGGRDLEHWLAEGFSKRLGYRREVLMDAMRFNAFESATRIQTPALIIHGDRDKIVPPYQSRLLRVCLAKCSLKIVSGAGHDYSGPGEWERMAEAFEEWFVKSL